MKTKFYFLAVLFLVLWTVGCRKETIEQKPEVAPQEKTLRLKQPPKTWGKPIGSSGKVIYYDNSPGVLSGRIALRGLAPDHDYVLTLNGKPPHPSNDLLPEKHGREGIYDFMQITSDSGGAADSEIDPKLDLGDYNVKFFVKDPTDWKIVLYNDFFVFTVK